MDPRLEKLIRRSGLDFLMNLQLSEKTPGRIFSEKFGGGKIRFFYVVLLPGVESPIHNHAGENMDETHMLLHGSGRFYVYNQEGEMEQKINLRKGRFHGVFSTREFTPNHKYVAGPEGSVTLALERYY